MMQFTREFHQSDIEKFKLCPRMFYYQEVLGIEAERMSEVALAGTAMHAVIRKAHAEGLWDAEKLFAFWQGEFEHAVSECLSAGTEVQRGTIDPEDYRAMLGGYVAKPWNRKCEVLLSEKAFTFEITPRSTTYPFGGHVDQVVKVPVRLLVSDFPMFQSFPRREVILHRDFKTGQRRGTSEFELLLNDQLSVYAYAFKHGTFDLDEDGNFETCLDLVPDFHVLYFLRDHIPYKRPPKNNSNGCRGQGMYFTTRSAERLQHIPKEVMTTCASIRRGEFPREGVVRGLCEQHCPVRQCCETDLLLEINPTKRKEKGNDTQETSSSP